MEITVYSLRVLSVLSCLSCSLLTSPDSVMSPGDWDIILPEWQICQDKLSVLGVRSHTISPYKFIWRAQPSTFMCGNVEANGCYTHPTGIITWNRQTPTVIRHECAHAILAKLGYKCWRDYEHGKGGCPNGS